ncbi:MAG: hypothetical protein V3R57_01325, partial [Candidatus Bathyarchaeia archaeon]
TLSESQRQGIASKDPPRHLIQLLQLHSLKDAFREDWKTFFFHLNCNVLILINYSPSVLKTSLKLCG